MNLPQIEWDFKHLPANRDEMQPVGTFIFDKETMLVALNITRGEVVFIWGDNYGKLISGEALTDDGR